MKRNLLVGIFFQLTADHVKEHGLAFGLATWCPGLGVRDWGLGPGLGFGQELY